MKKTEDQFLQEVKGIIAQDFDKDPGTYQSATQLMCWVSAYMQAEDSSLSTKDLANIFLCGLPPINTEELALEYWKSQYEMAVSEEDADNDGDAILDCAITRLHKFFAGQ